MVKTPAFPPDALSAFPAPHLAVDLVLLTICGDQLKVMMMPRAEAPFAGRLVLPGGFVHPGECLDDTARRVLASKAKLAGVPVEQIYSFSEPDRDPRGWVVSVAYCALVPCDQLMGAMDEGQGLDLIATVPADGAQERQRGGWTTDGGLQLLRGDEVVEPGFDHHAIVSMAVQRLRGKLDWSMAAFGLLGEAFTLFELQRVHELILGRAVNKPHFRKKMLGFVFADGRQLAPTGRFSRAGRHRPAGLYRLEAPG